MTRKQKVLTKIMETPFRRDITFQELTRCLSDLGYEIIEGSGSRVKFYNPETEDIINIHKPHPGNELKVYQVKIIQDKIRNIN